MEELLAAGADRDSSHMQSLGLRAVSLPGPHNLQAECAALSPQSQGGDAPLSSCRQTQEGRAGPDLAVFMAKDKGSRPKARQADSTGQHYGTGRSSAKRKLSDEDESDVSSLDSSFLGLRPRQHSAGWCMPVWVPINSQVLPQMSPLSTLLQPSCKRLRSSRKARKASCRA